MISAPTECSTGSLAVTGNQTPGGGNAAPTRIGPDGEITQTTIGPAAQGGFGP